MGISRNGTIDRERTEELKLARDDDIVDDCAREARGIQTIQTKYVFSTFFQIENNRNFSFIRNISDQKDKCTRAYHFLRCITIHNLIMDDVH